MALSEIFQMLFAALMAFVIRMAAQRHKNVELSRTRIMVAASRLEKLTMGCAR
jgi:hypothetical protein